MLLFRRGPRRAAGRGSDKAGRKEPLPLRQRGDKPTGERPQEDVENLHPPSDRKREVAAGLPKPMIRTDPVNPSPAKFYEFHSVMCAKMVMLMELCFKLAEHILKRKFLQKLYITDFAVLFLCNLTA